MKKKTNKQYKSILISVFLYKKDEIVNRGIIVVYVFIIVLKYG